MEHQTEKQLGECPTCGRARRKGGPCPLQLDRECVLWQHGVRPPVHCCAAQELVGTGRQHVCPNRSNMLRNKDGERSGTLLDDREPARPDETHTWNLEYDFLAGT